MSLWRQKLREIHSTWEHRLLDECLRGAALPNGEIRIVIGNNPTVGVRI